MILRNKNELIIEKKNDMLKIYILIINELFIYC